MHAGHMAMDGFIVYYSSYEPALSISHDLDQDPTAQEGKLACVI